MSKLDEWSKVNETLGLEKEEDSLKNKNSGWAYIIYLKPMAIEEINFKGELVLQNSEKYEGQMDLIRESNFLKISSNFPESITGNLITYGALENMLSFFYNNVKKEYYQSGESDESLNQQIERLDEVLRDGKLKDKHQNEYSLNDLANKVYWFQENVRKLQRINLNNSNAVRK